MSSAPSLLGLCALALLILLVQEPAQAQGFCNLWVRNTGAFDGLYILSAERYNLLQTYVRDKNWGTRYYIFWNLTPSPVVLGKVQGWSINHRVLNELVLIDNPFVAPSPDTIPDQLTTNRWIAPTSVPPGIVVTCATSAATSTIPLGLPAPASKAHRPTGPALPVTEEIQRLCAQARQQAEALARQVFSQFTPVSYHASEEGSGLYHIKVLVGTGPDQFIHAKVHQHPTSKALTVHAVEKGHWLSEAIKP